MIEQIVGGIGVLLVLVLVLGYVRKWNDQRHVDNALDGEYGQETQWAAELSQEGDTLFEIAATELPQEDLMEVGIVAESKEELRELTVERLEEKADEQLPEEFA